MAEKQLKSLKLHGLDDTYTIPTAPEHIGAAPAGYGLGVDAPSITLADCNDATRSGWYRTSGSTVNQPVARGNWMRVDAFSSTYLCQTWFNDQYDGCTATRFKIGDNKWTPWEWVNPPMALGVEYRTTERWNGKVVYAMLVDFGQLPNTTTKVVEFVLPYPITAISATGFAVNSVQSIILPNNGIYVAINNQWGYPIVQTESDYSAYHGYITIRYTKS
jgi:hypothetical protein